MPDDDNAIDLDAIETMSDEQLDQLAATVLGVDDDDAQPDAGKPAGDQPAGDDTRLEGGEGKPTGDTPQVTVPKGKDLVDALVSDPAAKALIDRQLQQYLAEASASADAKAKQDEFNKLLEDGNYDEIGRRFIADQQRTAVTSAAEQEGLKKAYTQIYGGLFAELEKLELTDADKEAIDPSKFGEDEDAKYILHLSQFIQARKGGQTVEEQAKARADEILQALANQKSAAAATSTSVSAGVLGAVDSPTDNRQSSRDLISDGFREEYESRQERRVLAQ